MQNQIFVLAHNIRSTHNIGSIFRTCDGLGVNKLYLTGYSPYPKTTHEKRLPHIAEKLNNQITKTALGAENSVSWEYFIEPIGIIKKLKQSGFSIASLEQNVGSIELAKFKPPKKTLLILGEELAGVDQGLINMSDFILEIPMLGSKESFNVSVAAALAIYHLRYS